jgi:hypothetical protein
MRLNTIRLLTGATFIAAVFLVSSPSFTIEKIWYQTVLIEYSTNRAALDQDSPYSEPISSFPVEQIVSMGMFVPSKRCSPVSADRPSIRARARAPPHTSPVLAGLFLI